MTDLDIYRVDRIEEGIATVENSDGAMLHVSASRLPENSKSGDCLTFKKGRFYLAPEKTKFIRKNVKNILDNLISEK